MGKEFIIDERLSNSCFLLAQWKLSNLYLKNEADYRWFILVPRVNNAKEIFELSFESQQTLITEISDLTKLIHTQFKPEKINVATLGNIVNQLHIHVVARYKSDPLWPQGIWQSALQSTPYNPVQLENLLLTLTNCLKNYDKMSYNKLY